MTDRSPRSEVGILREPCAQCGAMCEPGEYHRYSFCVLAKAGLDPWREIRVIAGQLGLGDPGETPPKVWELHDLAPALAQAVIDAYAALRLAYPYMKDALEAGGMTDPVEQIIRDDITAVSATLKSLREIGNLPEGRNNPQDVTPTDPDPRKRIHPTDTK